MTHLDLMEADITERFAKAKTYRKNVLVKAVEVAQPTLLKTVLANGFTETTRTVPVGEWIVTNPGGEKYAINAEKFHARYIPEGNVYRAKGKAKIIPNHTNEEVEIMAPWGELQHGDKHCMFSVALDADGNLTSDRYIIGRQEFLDTYEEDI